MSTTADARAALLRALDQLDEAASDLGDGGEVRHLCVVYSAARPLVAGGCEEIGGWVSTSDPTWLHAAMLRRAADSLEGAERSEDDDE